MNPMFRPAPLSLLAFAALASCAKQSEVSQDKQINPIGLSGKPLIRTNSPEGGTEVGQTGGVLPPGVVLTPEEDIVYPDMENPDAGIPELMTLLSGPKRAAWEESINTAKRRSVREGKPIVIWFTDSRSSPMCVALNQELFSDNKFSLWAIENTVRMRVDTNIEVKDESLSIGDRDDRALRIKDYNNELKKRYKVMGYPTLIVLSPSGEVTGQYRGYRRGEATLMWGKLKHAVAVSQESYKGWRSSLEKQGYRDWEGKRNQKIFAKLVSYNNGNLFLIEPDGQRSRTKETNLSSGDQQWIAEQKKLRTIQ